MRDRAAIEEGDLDEMLLRVLDALADCLGDLGSLAETDADLALLVADDNESTEREARPPLTTFATRLMYTTFSSNSGVSLSMFLAIHLPPLTKSIRT